MEFLAPYDPCGTSGVFNKAIVDEIFGLFEKRAFKIVINHEIGNETNVSGGIFVLAVKNEGTDGKVFKSRYVVQWGMFREKYILVHNSSTVSQQEVWLLIFIETSSASRNGRNIRLNRSFRAQRTYFVVFISNRYAPLDYWKPARRSRWLCDFIKADWGDVSADTFEATKHIHQAG